MPKGWGGGDWSGALSHDYHPLYSFLTLAVHFFVNDWEWSAVLISIASGMASVFFIFLFLRETFGLGVAWLGSVFLAVHYRSVSISSDIQSDGLYLALFLFALWLAWRGLQRSSPALLGWSGAITGLAYLARPEGLGVAVVAAVMLGIYFLQRRTTFSEFVMGGSALVAGVLLFVIPYVLVQRVEHGDFSLTQKKSVVQLTGIETARSHLVKEAPSVDTPSEVSAVAVPALGQVQHNLSRRHKTLHALDEYFAEVFDAFRIEAIIPFLFGLYSMRGRRSSRDWFLLILAGLYSAALLSLAYHAGYLSKRHTLPIAVAGFGYVGFGIIVFGEKLRDLLSRVFNRPPRLMIITGMVFVIFLVPTLVPQLEPRRAERIAERRVAEWLSERIDASVGVAAGKRRTAYYAGGKHVPIESMRLSTPDSVRELRARGASFLIVDEPEFVEHFTALGVRRLYDERVRGREAVVFDLVDGIE